jgi:hypothetical protein
MIHLPSTRINLESGHMVVWLALRTEHDNPEKPTKPMHRARYIARGAEESTTPADPPYIWAEPIMIDNGHQVIVGVRNPNPDGHPNFTPNAPTLWPGLRALCIKLDKYVMEEMKALEDGVGAAEVKWSYGDEVHEADDLTKMASIAVSQGHFKRYIWWEILKCDVY